MRGRRMPVRPDPVSRSVEGVLATNRLIHSLHSLIGNRVTIYIYWIISIRQSRLKLLINRKSSELLFFPLKIFPNSSISRVERRQIPKGCPRAHSGARAKLRCGLPRFRGKCVTISFVYLDEFGHIGPYLSRRAAKYNESPVFGLAGIILPDTAIRPFATKFLQLKEHIFKREIAASGVISAQWEKKGTEVFTAKHLARYPHFRSTEYQHFELRAPMRRKDILLWT